MAKKVSRRSFVKIAGVTGAGVAGAAASLSAHLVAETVNQAPASGAIAASPQIPYVFFTNSEAGFVEAAIDRLIPKDELGPGALDLNVAHYIDSQLDSSFGNGERMYLEGPFRQGTEQQGYQLPLRPSEVYRIALNDIDRYCRTKFAGKVFAQLSTINQDQVLTGLEKGDISLPSLPAKLFFGLLLQNTLEGYFGDPIYGGNQDMGSWKMLGFPGARADFRADVGKRERVTYKPISLAQVFKQPKTR